MGNSGGAIIVSVLLGMLLAFLLWELNHDQNTPYKQGQIDCIQGKIHYELKSQPDGEVKWEEKK